MYGDRYSVVEPAWGVNFEKRAGARRQTPLPLPNPFHYSTTLHTPPANSELATFLSPCRGSSSPSGILTPPHELCRVRQPKILQYIRRVSPKMAKIAPTKFQPPSSVQNSELGVGGQTCRVQNSIWFEWGGYPGYVLSQLDAP